MAGFFSFDALMISHQRIKFKKMALWGGLPLESRGIPSFGIRVGQLEAY
jgi:hypothetical protein